MHGAGTVRALLADMTAPRQVLPGTSYLVTRRCAQQQFLLRPSAETSRIFRYVLAVAANRHGVLVHAYCVMSNHFHIVLTDPRAELPAFEQYLDSLVARAMNALLRRREDFWGPPGYSAVALTSPEDVVAKIAYVLANPVSAALVRRGREWPGLWSAPEQMGAEPIVAERPGTFFREKGCMPESVELALEVPPGVRAPAAFRALVAREVAALEDAAAKARAADGRGFLGAAKVLAQKPTARPASIEPLGKLNPRVAAGDRWKRIEALTRLKAFLESYRVAWRKRREGKKRFLFPAGTYLLRIAHGVPCAAT